VEAALAQIYKEVDQGEYRGGPAFYIEKGLGIKWYAILFAIATVFGVGLFLPGVQSNSIAASVNNAFSISPAVTGGVLVALLAIIVFGGTKRIGKVAEVLVPLMAGAYILVAVGIVLMNASQIPAVMALIFKSAFGAHQAFGGIIGSAVMWGVKRGIYSNEAGQGTAPQAAAAAEIEHPAQQGLVQAFSVYIDTLFVCSATAFMILITGTYNVYGENSMIVEQLPGVEIGPGYTQAAVDSVMAGFGDKFVAIALFFFAFSTLMAYYYIAETNVAYLFKGTKMHSAGINGLRGLILFATFYGAVKSAGLVWTLGDIGVGMMAWLNIIAILILAKPALNCLKDYEAQRKVKESGFTFDPAALGIKGAHFWEDRIKKTKAS
jgi:AGCS family alanine or glycine:cation symporter